MKPEANVDAKHLVEIPVSGLVKVKMVLRRLADAGMVEPDCAARLYASSLLKEIKYREMPIECIFSPRERESWMCRATVGVDPMVFDVIASSSPGEEMLAYVRSDRVCTFEEFTARRPTQTPTQA